MRPRPLHHSSFSFPIIIRTYATQQQHHHHRQRTRLTPSTPILTLEHFLLRQRALSLYRDIIRSCRRLPDGQARAEMQSYAREEFERQKEVTDLRRIRYLLSTGRAEWKRLRGMFGGELPF